MKLKFDSSLQYQMDAINSVINLFKGQPVCNSEFTVRASIDGAGTEGKLVSETGIGNRIDNNYIDDEDISKNLKLVQEKNFIPYSGPLRAGNYNFDIEMETGTGKTYVFLRTIFELNKKYGFTKFVIVVPSVAIKEGTIKSIDIMKEHFKTLYNNVIFDKIVYDSKNLGSMKDFAVSNNIRIMVMTIQAFNKNTNVIHNSNEKTDGYKPIKFIQDTKPIVIIDEPQTTISTAKAQKAVDDLNPLFTLRYSATHKSVENLIYRLNSVDAYEQNLVKEIEVASIETIDNHNNAYLKLISVDNSKSPITAKIEIEVKKGNDVERKIVTVRQGDSLYTLSGRRAVYEDYDVKDINAKVGAECVEFTVKDPIYLGEARGSADDDLIKRLQIRKTIEEHLEKEITLRKKGIKVLSLFFIDKVVNYRIYDNNGNYSNGKFAAWFEEEFIRVASRKKYSEHFKGQDIKALAKEIHNGYFAMDKVKGAKGKTMMVDTKESSETKNEDTYNLIMKDKEKLLSFDSKLSFIFSHSALREGWDNPNVFQICTLNETESHNKKRQEIGRGLRLCVNQDGERVHNREDNILTIMANESYEEFAKKLQKDYEEEGIKFGIIDENTFFYTCKSIITHDDGKEEKEYIGNEKSRVLYKFLEENKYIDKKGKVQDSLKEKLKAKSLVLPEEFNDVEEQIIETLKKVAGNLNIKNRADRKKVSINKRRYLSEEFKELWEKIKHHTTYSVEFDSENLIDDCASAINRDLKVVAPRYIYSKAKLKKDVSGISGIEAAGDTEEIEDARYELPDILTYLQNETGLTRKSIIKILKKSSRLEDFKVNPQKFMDEVAKIINRRKKFLIVDGIKYEKLGDYYAQELFDSEELTGYFNKNMLKAEKSIYDYVVYDSNVEENFANELEASSRVKVYAKLPNWFKIETPLGSYNPDWAVYIEKNNEDKLYFVFETKGSLLSEDRREVENGKIECGKKHFKALDTEAKFKEAVSFKEFIKII